MRNFLLIFITLMVISACQKADNQEKNLGENQVKPAAVTRSVRVRFTPQWTHQAQFAGFIVAKAKGFYKNYGLDVVILPGGADNPSATALKNGTADFASLFLITALREYSAGNRLVNIGQISQRSALMLIGKSGKGISDIPSLNDKKIGLWRSDFQDLSLILFKIHKIKPLIVPIDNSISTFISGAVDVVNAMNYNEYHQLVQSGFDPQDLWTYSFAEGDLNIPEDGIYVREEFYRQNPDVCRDFADATMQGWLYAINHHEEALTMVMNAMRDAHLPVNRPHQSWMLNRMKDIILAKPHSMGKLSEEDFEQAVKLMYEHNMIANQISYGDFCPHD